MFDLLSDDFDQRVLWTTFIGIWVLSSIWGVFVKTKQIESKKKKKILRIAISCVLVFVWLYFIVYRSLYPISLAYYEYKNDLTNEKIGVIYNIEQLNQDRMKFVIDDTKYTIVYSWEKPLANIGKDIVNGDVVKIVYGKNSKFVFNMYKQKTYD
ncbi:MAG: hypothetical protein IKT42_01020 [Clostridia bacterium]|nr:hypothetical protein [Clostridia bacterium]